jgi:hypothetical protein
VRRALDPVFALNEDYKKQLIDIARLTVDAADKERYRARALEALRQGYANLDVTEVLGGVLRGQVKTSDIRLKLGDSDSIDKQVRGSDATERAAKELGAAMERQSGRAFDRIEESGTNMITAIGQVIGGRFGDIVSTIGGVLQGLKNGDFTGVGGKAGGILSLGSKLGVLGKSQDGAGGGDGSVSTLFGKGGGFQDAFKSSFKGLGDALRPVTEKLKGVFGGLGKAVGSAAGTLAAGASIGGGIASILGGNKTGGAIGGAAGGALGSIFGPIGKGIGSVLGGVVGSLFGKQKATGTITTSGGGFGSNVNGSKGLQGVVSSTSSSVTDALLQAAGALGASIKDGLKLVSITAKGKDEFIVDYSGSGRTKGSGTQKFKDQAEAIQAAIADAIKDGVLDGLSNRVNSALKSDSNIEKALSEALKVQSLEDLVTGYSGVVRKSLRDFETAARERLRLANKYGFDIVAIEKINGEERKKIYDDLLNQTVGGARKLLESLQLGSNFEGSPAEQLKALSDEIAKQRDKANGGDTAAAQKLAELLEQRLNLAKDVYGTAGGFGIIRSDTEQLLNQFIGDTERRFGAIANGGTEALLNEANDINARNGALTLAQLQQLNGNFSALFAGGGSVDLSRLQYGAF